MSTTTAPVAPVLGLPATATRTPTTLASLHFKFLHIENSIHHQLVKHSITALRISLGIIFLGFGILKYFGGISPAQTIVEATTHILFIGLIPGAIALRIVATLECVIGLCLLANRGMRLAVWLLAFEFIGILAPIFLFPAHLFSGPDHAPTLLAQYCLKDIILVAGALVVAAGSFRGGRMVRDDLPPNVRLPRAEITDPNEKLAVVLNGMHNPADLAATLERHSVTESEFHLWRDTVLLSAREALSSPVIVETPAAPELPQTPAAVSTSAQRSRSLGRGELALLALAVLRGH